MISGDLSADSSYPVGLLIGLFPIAVDLGETRRPRTCFSTAARLRGDGALAGLHRGSRARPRVHLLELVRTDAVGHVTERVYRWINRPGIEPEVLVAGGCDEKRHHCEFDVTWAHPGKLDPKRVSLAAGRRDGMAGARTSRENRPADRRHCHRSSWPTRSSPDGTRATYTRTLYAFYPEEAQALAPRPPDRSRRAAARPTKQLAATLKSRGPSGACRSRRPSRTSRSSCAERGFDNVPSAMTQAMANRLYRPRHVIPLEGSSGASKSVQVLFPNESLTFATTASQLAQLEPSSRMERARFSRYADAVAAAGIRWWNARDVAPSFLCSPASTLPNVSTFSAAQARVYSGRGDGAALRVADRRRDGAGMARGASSHDQGGRPGSAEDAAGGGRPSADRMARRIPRHTVSGRWLAPGLALAGREYSSATMTAGSTSISTWSASAIHASGPDGGPVHALATASDGSTAFAGTHAASFARTTAESTGRQRPRACRLSRCGVWSRLRRNRTSTTRQRARASTGARTAAGHGVAPRGSWFHRG